MGFAADVEKFTLKAKLKSDLLVRKVIIDVTSELVKLSPVDTGMFRANWFVGASLPTDTTRVPDKTGASSIARAASMSATLKAGGTTWIANNLPYALALEYGSYSNPGRYHWHPRLKAWVIRTTPVGFSTQAPAGMVRITAARWQPIVDKAARSLDS